MSEPRWLDRDEMAAWTTYLEATHLVGRQVEQHLREQAGLSHPQYEILVRLADHSDGSMRMSELAVRLITSKSRLTYQVGLLEKAGLLERHACPTDDRGVVATLTEAGREKLRATAPDHVAVVRSALIDHLSRTQLAALTAALGTVTQAASRE